jgi:putative flippase GtrA
MSQYAVEKDIFDRIMSLPVLNIFEPFYRKHKEVLMYLFFGGLAFFLSIFLFWFMDKYMHLNEVVNNSIDWIICVIFQFVTNRTWVFDGRVDTRTGFVKQAFSFGMGRVFTLIVENVLIFIFINLLGYPKMYVKLAATFVVIVLNYIISKLIVFKKAD